MKKEKTIKTYQRRTKSGKMVTVKQHTAKYDAADRAKEMASKEGAGDELAAKKEKIWQLPMNEFLKKLKEKDAAKKEQETPDAQKTEAAPKKTPKSVKSTKTTKNAATTQANGVSASDFKSWYHFNDWDKPKKSWPAEVRAADAAIRKQLGSKKAYDDYCSQIDNSYSKSGHNKAFKSFGGGTTSSAKAKTTTKGKDGFISHIDGSTFWTKEIKSKKVGNQFSYSEGKGKDKMTYAAHFVTNGKGGYSVVVNDGEKPTNRSGWATAVFDGYENSSQLPAGIRKAAKEQGLTFKNGEFVKSSKNVETGKRISSAKMTKGDRAVAKMNKLVNEAFSSTTSDPKVLKKQLRALIDYNGSPINYGDKIGKRMDEIREQLGKRSSSNKGKSVNYSDKAKSYYRKSYLTQAGKLGIDENTLNLMRRHSDNVLSAFLSDRKRDYKSARNKQKKFYSGLSEEQKKFYKKYHNYSEE